MAVFILSLIATLLHAAMVFAGAPLLAGLAVHLRARFLGRPGPPVLQPYFHLAILLRKLPAVPDTATALYPVWPYLCCAALAGAVLLVPGFATGMLTAPASDLLAVIGMIALARFAIILAGMETGFGFGGAGMAREALRGVFGEAGLIVTALVFVLLAHTPNLDGIVGALRNGAWMPIPLGFALAALLAVALADLGAGSAEGAELGLGRAAARLEYSGRFLALLDYAEMLRLMLWLNLLAALFLPFFIGTAGHLLSWPLGLVLWVMKLLLLVAGWALLQAAVGRQAVLPLPVWPRLALLLGAAGAVLLLGFGGAA